MAELKDTAILLTAHPRQQKWWAPVLLSLERYPGPLVLAYDDIDTAPIPAAILERFAAVVVTGTPAGSLGQAIGELVCLQLGLRAVVALGAACVLKLGFDEPPWRWRNITELRALLAAESLDCLDCETRVFLGAPALLSRAMDATDVSGRRGGSAECYWTWALGAAGVRRRRLDDRAWWERQLGLIHLQGEYAANVGRPNGWSWTIGELWPRGGQGGDDA